MKLTDSNFDFEVVVVGAGPGGSIAAGMLAKEGKSVALLDKANFPRYKTCGGGLTHRVMKYLPIEISSEVEFESKKILASFNNLTQNLTAKNPTPLVRMVMRDAFDEKLMRYAVQSGVQFFDGCAVTDIKVEKNRITVITGDQLFTCRHLIGADGVLGVTAKKTFWSEEDSFKIPAVEYEITVSEADFKKFTEYTRFDWDVLKKGYGWVFPKKTHLSVGVASFDRVSQNLHELTVSYLKSLGLQSFEIQKKSGYQIPIKVRSNVLAKEGVSLIGDAAGLADPLTAEGIYYSIRSGILAAESISKSKNAKEASANYNEVIQELVHDQESAAKLAKFFYDFPSLRSLVIRGFGNFFMKELCAVVLGEKTYTDILDGNKKIIKILKKFIRAEEIFHLKALSESFRKEIR